MPKSQKTNSAYRASTKKQKDSKSTLFAKLRAKYHNLAPHQQASLKRIAILMVLLLIFCRNELSKLSLHVGNKKQENQEIREDKDTVNTI